MFWLAIFPEEIDEEFCILVSRYDPKGSYLHVKMQNSPNLSKSLANWIL